MKTHEIFRFLNLRPVQKSGDDKIASRFYKYDKVSPLHQKIKALKGDDAREKSLELAQSVLEHYVDIEQVDSLAETLRKVCSEEKVKDAKAIFAMKLVKMLKNFKETTIN
jgi:hypothetical protein